MEFRKFNSLENTYQARVLSAIADQGIGEGDCWIVTEKVDGANFAFYFDGVNHKIASRNQFVDGTFFACQPVVDKIQPLMEKLFNPARDKQIIVYGELYGPSVQGRINYGEKGFVAFDLVVTLHDDVQFAVDKVVARAVLEHHGFPVIPLIGRFDTLNEALAVSSTFRSHLTPEDHEGDNFAEGVVIEPALPSYFRNGSRVYLKNRSPEFSEISNAKYKAPATAVATPQEIQSLLEAVVPYLTENRVNNVRSKLGDVSGHDFGKLLKLTVSDAIEDFEKDTESSVEAFAGANLGLFHKLLAKAATEPVRAVFLANKQ